MGNLVDMPLKVTPESKVHHYGIR